MMHAALAIAHKDLKLHFGGKSAGFVQSLLLGLLLIFLFSLSLRTGEIMTAQAASTVFWVATCFCQVLIFNGLYAHEETQAQRTGLLLSPAPPQSVWLGKALAAFCLVLLAQVFFLPAVVVFLGQHIGKAWAMGLCMILVVDIGIIILGALLGALAQGQSARESLFSIVIFPLLVPILLAGIKAGSQVFMEEPDTPLTSWLGMTLAFDAIFAAASLLLFPYLFTAEE